VALLRRSQDSLEVVNQRLEEAYLENKRRLREKEEVWEAEVRTLKSML
jgi:hypothetical protein